MTTATAMVTAHSAPSTQFTNEQIELIKRTVAEGTSDDELALFMEVARSSGLNPFQKQIYAIMRNTYNPRTKQTEPRMTIQTGIDGYRLLAARTGQHAGTSDVVYGPVVNGFPEWARVIVRRITAGGLVAEFPATARWAEYVQTKDEYRNGSKTGAAAPSGQWGKMPYLMLGKCAEALALRKAFPAELSGVYTAEEMSQADSQTVTVIEPARVVETAPTKAEQAALFKRAAELGVDTQTVKNLLEFHFDKNTTGALTRQEYVRFLGECLPEAAESIAQVAELETEEAQ